MSPLEKVSILRKYVKMLLNIKKKQGVRDLFNSACSFLEAVLKSLDKFVKHNLDEDHLNHSLSCLGKILIVNGEPAKVLQQREGTFDDPTFWEDRKFALTFVWSKDDLYDPTEFFTKELFINKKVTIFLILNYFNYEST